jgi:hypothetical protein
MSDPEGLGNDPAGDDPASESAGADLETARTRPERLAEAKRLYDLGAIYSRGCSQFMSAVLGISYEQANQIMGTAPTYLGEQPPYDGLKPGDVVGWKADPNGHVALFLGESDDKMFIDVREDGAKPRIKNGYYGNPTKKLYKSDRY